jgi:hypothetical protein
MDWNGTKRRWHADCISLAQATKIKRQTASVKRAEDDRIEASAGTN